MVKAMAVCAPCGWACGGSANSSAKSGAGVGASVRSSCLPPKRDKPVVRKAREHFADDGAIEQTMALYEQMEEKDAHLFSVAQTRRLAVTGLEWEIVSAVQVREGVDRAAADEAAA